MFVNPYMFLCLTGVTLPVFEHYHEGTDSKCETVYVSVSMRFPDFSLNEPCSGKWF